jgi:PAS domain S-box-containing protein
MATIASASTAREMPAITRNFASASAEVLGAILDQSVDCIKLIGNRGTLDFMNRNGRCAMEIDNFDDFAGRLWWDLWPEESLMLVRGALERGLTVEDTRFEAFCPTAKGTPKWWDVSVSPLRDEQGRVQGIVSTSRDVSDQVRAREMQKTASEEMRHRLQNAYTLTGAIVMGAAKGSPEREAFALEILERLKRLAVAQALLLDASRDGSPSLTELVQQLTEPFCGNHCALSIEELPPVKLSENDVRTLALTIGELSTNSNKYGAFGNGGSIAISGALSAGVLDVMWSERSLAAAPDQAVRGGGNGFKLIRRALGARGGDLAIDWRDDGLEARIHFPGV